MLPRYLCVITPYGPYGFYRTPDTIFVNVSKRNVEQWFETLFHEMLHLILFEETQNKPWQESERIIDQTFVRVFGGLFPKYQVQKF